MQVSACFSIGHRATLSLQPAGGETLSWAALLLPPPLPLVRLPAPGKYSCNMLNWFWVKSEGNPVLGSPATPSTAPPGQTASSRLSKTAVIYYTGSG